MEKRTETARLPIRVTDGGQNTLRRCFYLQAVAGEPAPMTSKRTVSLTDLSDRWEGVASDPDLEQDLGYRLADWERVSARAADGERFLFLPTDEELLREEAFVVAGADDVCDVVDHA